MNCIEGIAGSFPINAHSNLVVICSEETGSMRAQIVSVVKQLQVIYPVSFHATDVVKNLPLLTREQIERLKEKTEVRVDRDNVWSVVLKKSAQLILGGADTGKKGGVGKTAKSFFSAVLRKPHRQIRSLLELDPARQPPSSFDAAVVVSEQSENALTNQLAEMLEAGDEAGIITAIQELSKIDYLRVANPLFSIVKILEAMSCSSAAHYPSVFKLHVLSIVSKFMDILCLQHETENRKLSMETQKELLEHLKQIQRNAQEEAAEFSSIEHQISVCKASLAMIGSPKQYLEDRAWSIVSLVLERDAVNISKILCESSMEFIRGSYRHHWYSKILYLRLIVFTLIHTDEAQRDRKTQLLVLLRNFAEENKRQEWEVVVSIVQAFSDIIEYCPQLQEEVYFGSPGSYTSFADYFDFHLFSLRNNSRVRERTLQNALLLLENASLNPVVKQHIEGQILNRKLLDTNDRIVAIFKNKDYLIAANQAMKKSWNDNSNQAEITLEDLKNQIVETQNKLLQIPDKSHEKILKIQREIESQCLVLQHLRNETAELNSLGIHIENLGLIPRILDRHSSCLNDLKSAVDKIDEKLDSLVGKSLSSAIVALVDRIKTDRRRQQEHRLYQQAYCVQNISQINQENVSEPIEYVLHDFINSLDKVLLIAAPGGSGKTMALEKFEEELLNSFDEQAFETSNSLIPLRIELGGLEDPVRNAVREGLENKGFSTHQIEQLKRKKNVVLILDGVDEASQGDQRFSSTGIPHLYFTNQLFLWDSSLKVIFGHRLMDEAKELNTSSFSPYTNESMESRRSDLLRTAFICPFQPRQVKSYLTTYTEQAPRGWRNLYPDWVRDGGIKYLQILDQIPGAKELIQRPFILRIAAEVLPSIVAESDNLAITEADFFAAFARRWIEREHNKLIGTTLPAEIDDFFSFVWDFCIELARQMEEHNLTKVVYSTPAAFRRIRNCEIWDPFFGNDPVSRICRRAAPLKKGNCKEYSFIHLSIQHFFEVLAAKIEAQESSV